MRKAKPYPKAYSWCAYKRTVQLRRCDKTADRELVERSFTLTHSRGTYTRTLPIRSVLINGLCNFEDEIGAARRRPHRTPSKTVVQVSKCVLFFALANEWHNKGTILFYASAECCPPLCGHRGFPCKGER